MKRYAVIDKREGETPLIALERFRLKEAVGDVPLTYAGRLDPMASGKLLVLIGDECKKRAAYDALDKEYEVEVLFGFSSDTGDILGLSDRCGNNVSITRKLLTRTLARVRGQIDQEYPAFSSKTVDGKPLFVHALEGTLDSIDIPRKRVRVYKSQLLAIRETDSQTLLAHIENRIARLQIDKVSENPYRDFRRDEVLARWREILVGDRVHTIAKVRMCVSSGTYMRSLASLIAKDMGTCALAYTIQRTRIGRYASFGRLGFWWKLF